MHLVADFHQTLGKGGAHDTKTGYSDFHVSS
jgi:hypothetical protein